jgi:hypothetical protein
MELRSLFFAQEEVSEKYATVFVCALNSQTPRRFAFTASTKNAMPMELRFFIFTSRDRHNLITRSQQSGRIYP